MTNVPGTKNAASYHEGSAQARAQSPDPQGPPVAAPAPARAWIGVGANLGDPERQVTRALRWLASVPGVQLAAVSSFHWTAPVGPPQPWYVNAVARVTTRLSPMTLLRALQSLEGAARRERLVRWGPRTLDLDLLVYGDDGARQVQLPELRVPHPRLAERRFVLAPLSELDPQLVIPGLDRRVEQLLQALTS